MYSRYAIFTDLDGTLFNSHSRVSEENRRAIRYFVEHGGIFGISTGRSPENAAPFLEGIPINGWSVVLNGAASWNPADGEIVPCGTLDKQDAGQILEWLHLQEPSVNIQICTDRNMYYLTKDPYVDTNFRDLHREMKPADPEDIRQENWLKILLCAPRTVLETVREFARTQGLLTTMDWVYSSPEYLEFLPKGTSKGSCVERLRRRKELKNRTILAIGDYDNDLELLRKADIGAAVENAVPRLKQAADVIACSNDANSTAWLIYNLIPRLEENPDLFKRKKRN